jgi:3-hydroxyisobutyrate dehydrogenase-like beta-hydroxyacid dehydrogenase
MLISGFVAIAVSAHSHTESFFGYFPVNIPSPSLSGKINKNMITNSNKMNASFIGLGQMGKKMASLYAEAGFNVQVWNRSLEKAEDLKNVKVATSAEEAILGSQLIFICVHDNIVVRAILNSVSDKKMFAGKTIVNLTTGSPAEVEQMEKMINQYDGHYLNGAIQAIPEQMGLPGTTILISGEASVYEQYAPVLAVLGGNFIFLGSKASASSAMDLATLCWLYGSYIGLLYGVKISQSFGLKLEHYSQLIGEIVPAFTDFFKHQINVIDKEDWEISQSPLSISVSATERIAGTLERLPVSQEFPQLISSILKQADSRGLANKELAAIIKVIEKSN